MKTEIILIIVLALFALPNVLRMFSEFVQRMKSLFSGNRRTIEFLRNELNELERKHYSTKDKLETRITKLEKIVNKKS